YEEGVFRVSEEADGRAVPGVEDDAVVDGDVLDGLRQVVREARLEADLLGDRLLGVPDQVDEDDTADESSVCRILHVDLGMGPASLISSGNTGTYAANLGAT